jgi:hypothetical protein
MIYPIDRQRTALAASQGGRAELPSLNGDVSTVEALVRGDNRIHMKNQIVQLDLKAEAAKINGFHHVVLRGSREAFLAARDAGERLLRVRNFLTMGINDVSEKTNMAFQIHENRASRAFKVWLNENCGPLIAATKTYIKIFRNWELIKDCDSIAHALRKIRLEVPPLQPGRRRNGGQNTRGCISVYFNAEIKKWTSEERLILSQQPELIKIMVEEMRELIQTPVLVKKVA